MPFRSLVRQTGKALTRASDKKALADASKGIEAAADADKALAALKAAEELHQEGTRLLQSAHAHGVPRPFDGGYLMRPIDTEINERAMWEMQ